MTFYQIWPTKSVTVIIHQEEFTEEMDLVCIHVAKAKSFIHDLII